MSDEPKTTIHLTWVEMADRAKEIMRATPSNASNEVIAEAARRTLHCIEIARHLRKLEQAHAGWGNEGTRR